MNGEHGGVLSLLKNVVAAVYPDHFPAVFLQKFQQVFVFPVLPSLQEYYNTYNTYCQRFFVKKLW